MNLIMTLPCGCHRGVRECELAQSLRAAMRVAYQDVESMTTVFSEDYRDAWQLYELCRSLYFEHVEEQTQKREVARV